MKLQFAAVKRNEKYSPNHVTNDTLILNITGEELKKLGCGFKVYEESYIEENNVEENYIFSMARSRKAIENLSRMYENGKFVLNSPAAVLNCYRTNLASLLPAKQISFPKSKIVTTGNTNNYQINEFTSKKKLWIKRGDIHAEHKEDVSLVYYDEELNHILKEYSMRGIKEAIIQEHLDGDVVKFYGVKDTPFFHWYYLNGEDKFSFDTTELKETAYRAADVLNVSVYGGDAVISDKGEITIIDFNDWPSFAPVRNKASKYIAETILKNALAYRENPIAYNNKVIQSNNSSTK